MNRNLTLLLLVLSGLVVAFGQPKWSISISILAGSLGYALFWIGLSFISSTKRRFAIATGWFALVQMVQLSWMTSTEYQGYYILFIYICLSVFLGLLFGCLTLLINKEQSLFGILAIASLWTLVEWGRLYYILCGFSWNPVGLSLTSSLFSLQWAAVWGVAGLSFWVMLTNLAAFRLFFMKERNFKSFVFAGALVLVPYLFGLGHLIYHEKRSGSQEYSVALLQTGLLPSEKSPMRSHPYDFIPAIQQWQRILTFLAAEKPEKLDFIILPEGVVPHGFQIPAYSLSNATQVLTNTFGQNALTALPPLQEPFAKRKETSQGEVWFVTNAFWAQTLANLFNAELIAGFDDIDISTRTNFNSAFHFVPNGTHIQRYEKRILLPLVEYLPFEWCRALTKGYGITEFFTHGKEAKIFNGRLPLAVSICYEETFADIIREGRLKGGSLLINVTNDSYFPFSSLPKQHFDHARIRAVENGFPLMRACNTGISAVIDSMGRTAHNLWTEEKVGALCLTFDAYQYKTLYTFWGDAGIISLSLIFFFSFIRHPKNRQNLIPNVIQELDLG